MSGARERAERTNPWHVKTGSWTQPMDWSLPHDQRCPGCEIDRLLEENERLRAGLQGVIDCPDFSARRAFSMKMVARAALVVEGDE